MAKDTSAKIKLSDMISTMEKDQILYIGSKTGYFFIGTAEEYEKGITELSRKYHEAAEVGEANAIYDFKKIFANMLKESETANPDGTNMDGMLDAAKALGNASERIRHYRDALSGWVDFQNRPVMDHYRKCWSDTGSGETVPGYSIIVSGTESGPYWMKSEWEKDKKKKKIGTV